MKKEELYTAKQLLTDKKFRSMGFKKLDNIINYKISYAEFEKIPGDYSHNKARHILSLKP